MNSPVRASGIPLKEPMLTEAAALFGISSFEPLGGFENLLLLSTRPAGRVLRLTHTSRRSEEMVVAEFAFMELLAESGVSTVRPVHSINDRLAESIGTSGGDVIVVSCMSEANGGHRPRSEWTERDIESYGRLLGSMHAAVDGFRCGRPCRPSWYDPMFDVGVTQAKDPDIHRRSLEIQDHARAAEATTREILIHQDAHLGNIFITRDGRLTIFDFDDSAYGTPCHDAAIVLFYWLIGHEGDLRSETRRFVERFMSGYESVASLPSDWPRRAEPYLSLREMDVYWLVQLEDASQWRPVETRFMEGRRNRILDDVPYLETTLAEILG